MAHDAALLALFSSVQFFELAVRAFEIFLNRFDVSGGREIFRHRPADVSDRGADLSPDGLGRIFQRCLPANRFVADFRFRLGDAEQIRRQFFPAHEIQGRTAFGDVLDLPQPPEIHVVETPVSGILKERVILDPGNFRDPAQGTLALAHLAPDMHALDALGLVHVGFQRACDCREICLGAGDFRLLAVAVHGDEVAGETGELVIDLFLAVQLPLVGNDVFRQVNAQRDADGHRLLNGLEKRCQRGVSQERAELGCPPETETVVVSQGFKAGLIWFQVERIFSGACGDQFSIAHVQRKMPRQLPIGNPFLPTGRASLGSERWVGRTGFGIYRVNFGSEWRAFTGGRKPAEQGFM